MAENTRIFSNTLTLSNITISYINENQELKNVHPVWNDDLNLHEFTFNEKNLVVAVTHSYSRTVHTIYNLTDLEILVNSNFDLIPFVSCDDFSKSGRVLKILSDE